MNINNLICLISLKIFLNISIIVSSYEYRYVPESSEFDKNLMYKSISNRRSFFHRRSDYNLKYLPTFTNLHYNDVTDINNNINNNKVNNNNNYNNNKNYNYNNYKNNTNNDIIYNNFHKTDKIDNKISNKSYLNDKFIFDDTIINSKFDTPILNELNRIEVKNNSNSVISIQNTFTNKTHVIPNFPIYFTNPTTGVVYAINEVGYNFSIINSLNNFDSQFQNHNNEYNNNNLNISYKVPIYIPKEQYDNDIKKLKSQLKNKCNQLLYSQKLSTNENITQSIFNHYHANKTYNSSNNYNSIKDPKKASNISILTLDEFNKLQNFQIINQSSSTPNLLIPPSQTLNNNQIKPIVNLITGSSEEEEEEEEGDYEDGTASIPNPAEAIQNIFNDVYETVGNNEESSSEESSDEMIQTNQNSNLFLNKDKLVTPIVNVDFPNKIFNKLPYDDKNAIAPKTELNSLSENFKPISLVKTTLASFINIPIKKKTNKYKKHNALTTTKPINKYSSTIFSRSNNNLNNINIHNKNLSVSNNSVSRNLNKNHFINNIHNNRFNNITRKNTLFGTEIYFEGTEIPENIIYDNNYLHKAGILILKQKENKSISVNPNQFENSKKKNYASPAFGSLNFFEAPLSVPIQQYKNDEVSSLNVLSQLNYGNKKKKFKRSLKNVKSLSYVTSKNVINEPFSNNFFRKEHISLEPDPLKDLNSTLRLKNKLLIHNTSNYTKEPNVYTINEITSKDVIKNFNFKTRMKKKRSIPQLRKLSKIRNIKINYKNLIHASPEIKLRTLSSKDMKFSKYSENFLENNLTKNKQKNKVLSTQIHVTSQFDDISQHRNSKENFQMSSTDSTLYKNIKTPPCKTNLKIENVYDDDEDYYDFDNFFDFEFDDDDDNDENNLEQSEEISQISDYPEDKEHDSIYKNKLRNRKRKTIEKHKKRKKMKYKNSNIKINHKEPYIEDEDGIGIFELMDAFTYPFRFVFQKFFEKVANYAGYKTEVNNNEFIDENRKPKYPKYTSYNKDQNNNSYLNWFIFWLNSWKNNKNSVSNDNTNSVSGWFDYWFNDNDDEERATPPTVTDEDYDYGHWLINWFGESFNKPATSGNTSSILSTTTTTVPILTIENPMKNPQKWIGILAQHIVDSTSSTSTPLTENRETSYNKYQIWRLKPSEKSQVEALEQLKRSNDGIKMQWLQGPTLRGLTDVLVPEQMLTNLQGTLNYEEITHEVLIYDVGKAIAYEKEKENSTRYNTIQNSNLIFGNSSWTRYHKYDDIVRFLEDLQLRNSEIVELFHIGRSYEGRPLIVIKISKNENQPKIKHKLKENKRNQSPGVFIEGGIHGREWITPATATWMINELVKLMKNNQTKQENEFIRKATWYILPVLNPDGYEYSLKYDRMWKKSRSKYISKPDNIISSAMEWFQETKSTKLCYGVDLSQNWEYGWGEKGSSKSPCNEFYAGPVAFSEPETRALSKFIVDHRKKIKLYLSLKAYGQIISYPNKITKTLTLHKLDELLDVAMVGNDGLRKYGSQTRYKVNSNNDLLLALSGSSNYFAMHKGSIPFSYTIHLGDNGVHGYLLPESNIESTSRDAFQIIKSILDYIY